jgi:hypothetical protein
MATYTNNWNKDQETIAKIRAEEYRIPAVFCDSCGNESRCKRYPLGGGGNAILCNRCWSKEYAFQTSDEKGYSIPDTDSRNAYKRNGHSWHMTEWYDPS